MIHHYGFIAILVRCLIAFDLHWYCRCCVMWYMHNKTCHLPLLYELAIFLISVNSSIVKSLMSCMCSDVLNENAYWLYAHLYLVCVHYSYEKCHKFSFALLYVIDWWNEPLISFECHHFCDGWVQSWELRCLCDFHELVRAEVFAEYFGCDSWVFVVVALFCEESINRH